MSLPLIVRPMVDGEAPMVLSAWKNDLYDSEYISRRLNKALTRRDFWNLVNHVVDRVSFPSAKVWVGCAESEPEVVLCWAAVRNRILLHSYAKRSLREDPSLSFTLQQELFSRVDNPKEQPFNLFEELRRP